MTRTNQLISIISKQESIKLKSWASCTTLNAIFVVHLIRKVEEFLAITTRAKVEFALSFFRISVIATAKKKKILYPNKNTKSPKLLFFSFVLVSAARYQTTICLFSFNRSCVCLVFCVCRFTAKVISFYLFSRKARKNTASVQKMNFQFSEYKMKNQAKLFAAILSAKKYHEKLSINF